MTGEDLSVARKLVGEKLRECRNRAGISIMGASKHIGISPKALVDLEDGRLKPLNHMWLGELFTLYKVPDGPDWEIGAVFFQIADKDVMQSVALETDQGGALASARPTPTGPGRVFLCHSSGDKERVRELYRKLKADNINCWFDEEDLMPGDDWEREITRAIKRSKYVLACLSEASIGKTGFVQKELKKALDVADEQPEGVAYIIPVRLEECEVPDRLSRWQWVDLFEDGSYERLLRRLKA